MCRAPINKDELEKQMEEEEQMEVENVESGA